VYAVWDRFLSPPGINATDQGKINARSYVEQTWFSRTTDSGATRAATSSATTKG